MATPQTMPLWTSQPVMRPGATRHRLQATTLMFARLAEETVAMKPAAKVWRTAATQAVSAWCTQPGPGYGRYLVARGLASICKWGMNTLDDEYNVSMSHKAPHTVAGIS